MDEPKTLLSIFPIEHTDPLDELRIAYANAMWSWAEVEGSLYTVYIAAIDGFRTKINPTKNAYFSIVSANSRFDMTNIAAKSRWDKQPELERWMPLYARCKTELRRRGKIAHLQGEVFYPITPNQAPIAVLIEHFWHPQYSVDYKDAKSRGVSAKQLIEMSSTWHQLYKDLTEFAMPLWDKRLEELKAKFSSPQSDQPQEEKHPRSSPIQKVSKKPPQ